MKKKFWRLKLKNNFVFKHKGLLVLTILSFMFIVVGFMHIPILKWCGVDVFALRGLLVLTALPIVALCAVPFSVCMAKWDKIRRENKKGNGD